MAKKKGAARKSTHRSGSSPSRTPKSTSAKSGSPSGCDGESTVPSAASPAPSGPSEPPLIVATRVELAKELKARTGKGSVRSLCDWFKMGCPNRPGAHNVDEIVAWVKDNLGDEETDDGESERSYWTTVHRRELALKAQLERLATQGELVERAVVDRLVDRLANTLTSMLQQWPDWVLSLLPKLDSSQRNSIRSAVAGKVDELGRLTADMLEEWAEEK